MLHCTFDVCVKRASGKAHTSKLFEFQHLDRPEFFGIQGFLLWFFRIAVLVLVRNLRGMMLQECVI